jgi:hypothetical protein
MLRRHLLRFSAANLGRIARETIIEFFPLVAVKHSIARPPGAQGIVLGNGRVGIAPTTPAKGAAKSDRAAVSESSKGNVRPVSDYLISLSNYHTVVPTWWR